MFKQVAYIIKVNLAHLNGWEWAWNITSIKKISDYNWDEYAYVSGQALRRYLKETLKLGGKKITSVDKDWNPYYLKDENDEEIKKWFDNQISKKSKWWDFNEFINVAKKVFKKYIDLDLFWFMFPNWQRRWSPVKVSPLISIFPWKWETDFLTRKQLVEFWENKSWNIVNVEIDSNNFMRWNIIINESLVWVWEDEYSYDKYELLDETERKERIQDLLEAIKNLTWGAVQSRNLEDISPVFALIINQKYGNPFLLNIVKVDRKWNLNINEIIDVLKENWIKNGSYIIKKGIFPNESVIIDELEKLGFSKF